MPHFGETMRECQKNFRHSFDGPIGGPASEARVVRTFSANDAAYLTLSRAVSQLRRCESVQGGGGLLSYVRVGLFQWKVGYGRVSFP